MLTLKLKEQPVGFDVVLLDPSGQEQPYKIGDQVLPGFSLRSKRQDQFQGSGTLTYVIVDTATKEETEEVQEIGMADLRDDCLIPLEKTVPNAPGWRLQTNSECFPKS